LDRLVGPRAAGENIVLLRRLKARVAEEVRCDGYILRSSVDETGDSAMPKEVRPDVAAQRHGYILRSSVDETGDSAMPKEVRPDVAAKRHSGALF
jgi:hypothetical protein